MYVTQVTKILDSFVVKTRKYKKLEQEFDDFIESSADAHNETIRNRDRIIGDFIDFKAMHYTMENGELSRLKYEKGILLDALRDLCDSVDSGNTLDQELVLDGVKDLLEL